MKWTVILKKDKREMCNGIFSSLHIYMQASTQDITVTALVI